MSEMLANHYFHTRDYLRARTGYEAALTLQPGNKAIRRRMVICCLETGAIGQALTFFEQLVEEDIEFILSTDPADDDCPCQELIAATAAEAAESQSLEQSLRLGMLWLYCDLEKAKSFFERVCHIAPDHAGYRRLLTLMESHCTT